MIKNLKVRKATLEAVYESLKDHYGRSRDFVNKILASNMKNII